MIELTPEQVFEAYKYLTAVDEGKVLRQILALYTPQQLGDVMGEAAKDMDEIVEIAAHLIYDGEVEESKALLDIYEIRQERKRKKRQKEHEAEQKKKRLKAAMKLASKPSPYERKSA